MTQLLQEFLLLNVPLEYTHRVAPVHLITIKFDFDGNPCENGYFLYLMSVLKKFFNFFAIDLRPFPLPMQIVLPAVLDTNTLQVILANGTYLDPADSVIYVRPQTPRCTAVDKSDDVLDH
jgi:hypothetical protein